MKIKSLTIKNNFQIENLKFLQKENVNTFKINKSLINLLKILGYILHKKIKKVNIIEFYNLI